MNNSFVKYIKKNRKNTYSSQMSLKQIVEYTWYDESA